MTTSSPSDPALYLPFEPPRSVSGDACGGAIGPDPEHFVVEEVPAYPLSGEGEHLFLWIEKKGLNTTEVAKRLSRASGAHVRDVGYAGMKDRNAVTRQWFSLCVPQTDGKDWDLGEGVTVLETTRHKNKLRTGHLIGNRFGITLTNLPDGALARASEIAATLNQRGLPNYFGPQRFGRGGSNLKEAFDWLRLQTAAKEANPEGSENEGEVSSEPSEKRRSRKRKKGRGRDARFDNKMMPSVIQSEIFNRYVALRLAREEALLLGEVVRLDGAGKSFVVEDLAAELPRRQSGDIHLTGPMWGPKTLQSTDDALALEVEALNSLHLTEEDLATLARHAPGARRDLMLMPEALSVKEAGPGAVTIHFTLPAGAYATQLIREFSGAPWQSPRGE